MLCSLEIPKVSFCIVTLSNRKGLFEVLESLEQYTSHIDYEVVTVDSATRCRGFVPKMNQCLAAAKGEILCPINDDILLTDGWIDPLLEELDKGTPCVFPDQTETDGFQILCGWCHLVSREAYEELEMYDPRYLFWCSDIDWGRQLIDVGHPAKRVPIPEPLKHVPGTTMTHKDADFQQFLNWECRMDLQRYQNKWQEDPNWAKFHYAST